MQLKKNTLLELANHAFLHYQDALFMKNIDGDAVSYLQANIIMTQIQSMLAQYGVKQGDKIAICGENMPHWGLAYLAITTMGAVVVPILADFHRNEIHHIIKHSEAKALFVSQKLANKLSESDFCTSLQYIFSLETLEIVEDHSPKHSDFVNKSTEKLEQLKAKALQFAHVKSEEKALVINEDDLAVIIYTSGTTGQSKGVMLSHNNLVSQALQACSLVDIFKADRFLSILPLAHTYECSVGFLVPFYKGASIHYLNKIPSPKIILAAMVQVKPTFMLSVPLVIEKIYKTKVQAKFNKNSLVKYLYENVTFVRKKLNKIAGKKLKESFGGQMRFFGIGGAKLSPFVEQFLQEADFPYAIGYGLTETSPIIAGAMPGKTVVGSTGVIAKWIEHKFIKTDESQRDGELHVRGPNIMIGYYKDQERTDEILDADGWLNTGDLGFMTDEGRLFINGRSKNVIIGASGENIYPEALESVLNQSTLVSDSMVYEKEGKVVAKIFIDYNLFDEQHNINSTSDSELHKDIVSLLDEIKNEANNQLAGYQKITEVFEQTDPFIKTPTKKIKRYLHT